jgi:F0F1-type ATP synthase membrane subunit b/b'
VLLFVVLSVHAAEEGGNAAQERTNEIFKWINFVLVAGGLFWLFGKVLPPKFRGNADTISSAITKATAAKAEADRQLREAEEKLAHLENEVAQLRATAQREGQTEAERIRNVTQMDAQRSGSQLPRKSKRRARRARSN